MEDIGEADDNARRYRAPALEKGLDILELLADSLQPLSFTSIAERLNRSRGELHRMVQVLQYRGYVEGEPGGDGYQLTDRLFSLGMRQPRTRNLVEISLPLMRQLTRDSGESCHLALRSQGEMVVVARVESGEQLGFSVRVGYRRSIHSAASGIILYAFQPPDIRQRWEALFAYTLNSTELAAFRNHADQVFARRIELSASPYVAGVTDISVPIMRGGSAAAALTVPYLERREPIHNIEEVTAMLVDTANQISEQLVQGDERV